MVGIPTASALVAKPIVGITDESICLYAHKKAMEDGFAEQMMMLV
jgi:hypothetical protein